MAEQETHTLLNYKFVVGDKPFCFWGFDLKARNLEFLNSFDPTYFEFLATRAYQELDNEAKMHASILIRTSYYHSLETFFSLLGATIQAPHFVIGWIMKCGNTDLRDFIKRVNCGSNTILNRLLINRVSFDSLSCKIFSKSYFGNDDRNQQTRRLFAETWSRMAGDFLDEKNISEYNSIKHGFRQKSGGFGIAFGLQEAHDIPCPPEKMESLGVSEFGSSFFCSEEVGTLGKNQKRNLNHKLIQHSLNWNPEAVAKKILMVSFSIKNVLSFLKIVDGQRSDTVQFFRPEADEPFWEPWSMVCSRSTFSISEGIPNEYIKPVSKEDVFKEYSEK
jgi:hypothetical protein